MYQDFSSFRKLYVTQSISKVIHGCKCIAYLKPTRSEQIKWAPVHVYFQIAPTYSSSS